MDESLQAPETPHSVDQRSVPAGSAQPCSLPKGRPKKIRPVTPSLAEELAVTLRHFFPELGAWLGEIPDSRDPDYAVFPLKLLLLQGVVMHLTHSGSRNHFNDQVRDSVEMAGTLAHLAQALDAGAHGVLAATLFHYRGTTVPEARAYLAQQGYPVRP